MSMPACSSAQYAHIAKRMLAPDAPQTIARKRSWRAASHLYGLGLLTLRSGRRSPMSMPDAGQRSMRPAHMSRLAASPLADIANLRTESVCDNHRATNRNRSQRLHGSDTVNGFFLTSRSVVITCHGKKNGFEEPTVQPGDLPCSHTVKSE